MIKRIILIIMVIVCTMVSAAGAPLSPDLKALYDFDPDIEFDVLYDFDAEPYQEYLLEGYHFDDYLQIYIEEPIETLTATLLIKYNVSNEVFGLFISEDKYLIEGIVEEETGRVVFNINELGTGTFTLLVFSNY